LAYDIARVLTVFLPRGSVLFLVSRRTPSASSILVIDVPIPAISENLGEGGKRGIEE
jgi:hypothetical protein